MFADATKRTTIAKTATGARTKKNVPASYFRLVRAALEAQTAFDPVTDDRFDELRDPKQLFQRARLLMDIPDKNDWTLFKTEMVDNRAVYRFTRDTTATFAFIFEPIQ